MWRGRAHSRRPHSLSTPSLTLCCPFSTFQYEGDRLADFRGTLSGVLGALGRESGVLDAAAALADADARRALAALRAARARCLTPVALVGGRAVGSGPPPHPHAPPARPSHHVGLALAPAGEADLVVATTAAAAAASDAAGGGDSPAHRSGVDLAFLRAHDVRLY